VIVDDYSSVQWLTHQLHEVRRQAHGQQLSTTQPRCYKPRSSTPFDRFLTNYSHSQTLHQQGSMTSNSNLLATAGVPAFLCPQGTKVHLLNLGTMRVDAGWYATLPLRTGFNALALLSHIAQASPWRQQQPNKRQEPRE
jgi:hypothetical protein